MAGKDSKRKVAKKASPEQKEKKGRGKADTSGKKKKKDKGPVRPVTFGDLPPRTKDLLSLYPVRQPVKWRLEDGLVTVSYRKEYTNLEQWLQKRLKGPTHVRRPLDECGTLIWTMCDGRNTILQICDEVDAQYHESVEPVFKTVIAFIERLHRTGLVRIERERRRARAQRVAREGGREEAEKYLVLEGEE